MSKYKHSKSKSRLLLSGRRKEGCDEFFEDGVQGEMRSDLTLIVRNPKSMEPSCTPYTLTPYRREHNRRQLSNEKFKKTSLVTYVISLKIASFG